MTTAHALLTGMIPAAYVLGSIPFGLLIARTRGIDPRKAGSGNIGATNVGRLLGKKFFAIVFVLDMLKGLVPTLSAAIVIHFSRTAGAAPTRTDYLLQLLAGFAAIVGHLCSMFLGVKGGKGVATSAGVILGVFPYFTAATLIGGLIFGLILWTTRYMSLASMAGAIGFGAGYFALALVFHWPLLTDQLPLLIFAILIPLAIIYKHRGNIARLRAGTENPLTKSAKAASDAPAHP